MDFHHNSLALRPVSFSYKYPENHKWKQISVPHGNEISTENSSPSPLILPGSIKVTQILHSLGYFQNNFPLKSERKAYLLFWKYQNCIAYSKAWQS